MKLAIGVALVFAASVAHAEFVTLDRFGPGSQLGADLSVLVPTEDGADFLGFRLDMHGEVLLSPTHGLYLSLPLSVIAGDGDNEGGIANLDVGGFYVSRVTHALSVIGRLGVALPTAPDDDALVNLATTFARIGDLVLIGLDTTWLRSSSSLAFDNGSVEARLDFGADVPIRSPESISPEPLIRFGFGFAGRVSPAASVGAEMANVTDGGETFSSVSLGGTFGRHELKTLLHLTIPLESELRGDLWILSLAFRQSI